MKISRTRLAVIIADKAAQPTGIKDLSREVAAYLLAEGRTGELDSIMRDVMQYRADHGIIEVIATDAHPISDSTRHDISDVVRGQFPQAKQIIVSEQLDPTIIGGVQLELANEQLDLSVRAKLNRFKQLTAVPGGA